MEHQRLLRDLSSEEPLLFHDGRFFELNVDAAAMADRSHTFPIVEVTNTSDLEKFYNHFSKEEIEKQQREYIGRLLQKDYQSNSQRKQRRKLERLAVYAILEVIPKLIDNTSGFSSVSGVSGRQIVEDAIRSEIRLNKIVKENTENARVVISRVLEKDQYSKQDLNKIVRASFGTDAAYITPSYIYGVRSSESIGNGVFSMQQINLANVKLTHEIDVQYATVRERANIRDELEGMLESVVEEKDTNVIEQAARQFLKIGRWQVGKVGFEVESGQVYVYYESPKYALKDPRKKDVYKAYPETKVGVFLYESLGEICRSDARVKASYSHPGFQSRYGKFVELCRLEDNRYDDAEGTVQFIADAVNMLHNGITMHSIKVHGNGARYTDGTIGNIFKGRDTLTRREAVRRGYLVTNEWHTKE